MLTRTSAGQVLDMIAARSISTVMPYSHAPAEQCDRFATVIVARKASDFPDPLVQRLVDAGLNVLGPVDTAARALALAAQTPADLAFISPELAGRRDGFELARTLEATWGVPVVMLAEG